MLLARVRFLGLSTLVETRVQCVCVQWLQFLAGEEASGTDGRTYSVYVLWQGNDSGDRRRNILSYK